MAIIAHFPQTPILEGTLDGGVLNTVFPPSDFNVGQFLYVRDAGANGTLYECLINTLGARYWFPVSNGSLVGMTGELSPMFFAGGLATQSAATVNGFMANDPDTTMSTSPLRFRRTRSGDIDSRLARLLVRVRTNGSVTDTVFNVLIDGAATGVSLTVGAGATGNFEAAIANLAFADGAGFDIEMTNTNGGGSVIEATATLIFVAV